MTAANDTAEPHVVLEKLHANLAALRAIGKIGMPEIDRRLAEAEEALREAVIALSAVVDLY